ncbi:MAG: beta-N-acetylhexosaminidase [Chloroflexia bacterium]|jgi:beta-N-acetylhexosaminidase|nr:beta-N-acetylhexosaminidase [Chloroflexia bacterium]
MKHHDTPPELPDDNPRATFTRRRFLTLAGSGLALALTGRTLAAPTQAQAATREETLDYKIAQMLMIGFSGSTLQASNPIVRDVRDRGVGGVFLMDYNGSALSNITSPAQVKTLTAGLRDLASSWPLPLLIAVDQEGGQVARLKTRYGFPATVSQQYLGTRNDLTFTHSQAQSIARTLTTNGLNVNFAPVVDVNTNPRNPIIGSKGRSFSANPGTVSEHALEVIKAHREQGVLCTLKHFPGHGSSTADSHLGFVDVTGTWSEKELQPYRQILAAGECDLVMTAHIFNSRLDPNHPATLSYRTITNLLREQLGFWGVVLSDDMQMKAISSHYSLQQALGLSISAGVDMITMTPARAYQTDLASRAIDIIKGFVLSGAISETRIEESYTRIKRLKEQLARRTG